MAKIDEVDIRNEQNRVQSIIDAGGPYYLVKAKFYVDILDIALKYLKIKQEKKDET